MCHDNHDSGWAKDGCRWVQMDIDGWKRVHWGACIRGDTEIRWTKTQGTRIVWKHDTWPGNFPDIIFEGGGTEEAQRRHRTTQMYSILCVRVVVCRYVCVSIETTRKKVKQSNKTDATSVQKKQKKQQYKLSTKKTEKQTKQTAQHSAAHCSTKEHIIQITEQNRKEQNTQQNRKEQHSTTVQHNTKNTHHRTLQEHNTEQKNTEQQSTTITTD